MVECQPSKLNVVGSSPIVRSRSRFLMQIPFINLRVEPDFNQKIKSRWEESLEKSQFIAGKALTELNHKILDFTKAKNFIPCANGTDAIQIALRAVGIGQGDYVLLPDFTFWATYEAIINVGAKPIMVDICPQDFQMDFDLFLMAVAKYSPKAIILVHLYGWCSLRLAEFREFCKAKNIYLIEDGAQVIGSFYQGKPIFENAFIATTSFYPAKVLGAAGDAGGIFTNNPEIAQICTQLANHGRSSHYGHEYVGWNSRLDEVQAHYLVVALDYLTKRIDSRRSSEKKYLKFQAEISQNTKINLPLEMKATPPGIESNGYLQVSLAKTSYKELAETLRLKGIGCGNVYPSPMSAQKGAGQLNELITKDRITYEVCKRVINLPLFPYMRDEEINYICESLIS